MNKDVIVACQGKQLEYAKANLTHFTYLGINLELPLVIKEVLKDKNNELVKPLFDDLNRYLEILEEIKKILKVEHFYNNECWLPKTLCTKMTPEDYAYEPSQNLDAFLKLYDIMHEAKAIEARVSGVVVKNKKLIASHKGPIHSLIKANEIAVKLEIKDYKQLIGVANLEKAQNGYYGYGRGACTPNAELTKIFNAWLQNKKPTKALIDEKISWRNYFHYYLEMGFFNSFDTMHLISQKMSLTKIADMEVFAKPRNSFALTEQKSFKFPEESAIYMVILENVNRVPSICYTKKVGSGNNTSMREVDSFEESTIFSNFTEAQEFSQRVYNRSTTVVKFGIGMKNPEVVVGSNANFTGKVEASFTKDKLTELLGGDTSSSSSDSLIVARKNKI